MPSEANTADPAEVNSESSDQLDSVSDGAKARVGNKRCCGFFPVGLLLVILVGGGSLVALAIAVLTGWYWLSTAAAGDSTETSIQVEIKSNADATPTDTPPEHPLDPALVIARDGLHRIQTDIRDYTASVAKRERIGGRLVQEQVMFCKIRNRRIENGKTIVPLGVYIRFDEPESMRGREVIWVEGKNDGKLLAHDPNYDHLFVPPPLEPDSPLAMFGNRYPITELGIENLVAKLLEIGEKLCARNDDSIEARYPDADLNGRPCRLIEVRQPVKKPEAEFFILRVFVDNELQIPVRYAAYTWPEKPDGEPVLDEEYTYTDVKLNVGLTDDDFDPKNSEYAYPK